MSRLLAVFAVAAGLATGIVAAQADPITPHGVWDMKETK